MDNRRTLLIVLSVVVGLGLLGAVIGIIALSPKQSITPSTNSTSNTTSNPSTSASSVTTPQPLTTQQSLQGNPPAQNLAAFVEAHKTTDLVDGSGKASFSVADQENIDGTHIYIDSAGSSGAHYLTIIDSTKSGAASVLFGPEAPASITDDQLHSLPDSVYNYLNYKLHGNY